MHLIFIYFLYLFIYSQKMVGVGALILLLLLSLVLLIIIVDIIISSIIIIIISVYSLYAFFFFFHFILLKKIKKKKLKKKIQGSVGCMGKRISFRKRKLGFFEVGVGNGVGRVNLKGEGKNEEAMGSLIKET